MPGLRHIQDHLHTVAVPLQAGHHRTVDPRTAQQRSVFRLDPGQQGILSHCRAQP